MPTLTTTIEDTAPIIVYSGPGGSDWRAGTSKDDQSLDLYSQGSYMVTNVSNAFVSFSFYGTGVQLFGAKRLNHSYFQITIDTIQYPQVNGVDEKGAFQQPLFSTSALANGYHTVRMQNLGTGLLDIDFITWQTPVGGSNEPLVASTYQDSDPSFKYTPEDAWNQGPPNLGTFSGGSGHITSTAGASVEYTFTVRDAVMLYGPVGPSGAPYSIQLDGGTPMNYSANKPSYRPQMVLYQVANLGGGEHTLVVRSEAWNNSALALGIDFAGVFTTPALQGDSSGLSTGAIVGIAVGGIFGLILLLFLAVLCLCIWKRGKIFWFRGRSRRGSASLMTTESFPYRSVSLIDSVSHQSLLHTQASSGSLRAMNSSVGATVGTPEPMGGAFNTPPSTGLWPPQSAGMYTVMGPVDAATLSPNTQVITIPFTPDGKYRPDLTQATPQLMAPPHGTGLRRAASSRVAEVLQPRATHPMRPTRSNMELGGLPPGAGQPALLNVDEEGADIYAQGQTQGSTFSPPALTPLRRPPTMFAPPEYRDHSPGR